MKRKRTFLYRIQSTFHWRFFLCVYIGIKVVIWGKRFGCIYCCCWKLSNFFRLCNLFFFFLMCIIPRRGKKGNKIRQNVRMHKFSLVNHPSEKEGKFLKFQPARGGKCETRVIAEIWHQKLCVINVLTAEIYGFKLCVEPRNLLL